ncbi:hypothetical protein PPYR_11548 [Photinus pyralis]|uniref:Uncharacterized protein n=1 Tax=Photinus pyralis TaxID=7054 RepID=A0A5N4ABP6_PHOPY|nr:hypothetical protein PPYR_11548 [Photinus pyralis]
MGVSLLEKLIRKRGTLMGVKARPTTQPSPKSRLSCEFELYLLPRQLKCLVNVVKVVLETRVGAERSNAVLRALLALKSYGHVLHSSVHLKYNNQRLEVNSYSYIL